MKPTEIDLVKKMLANLAYEHIFSDDIIRESVLLSLPDKEQLIFSGDNFDALFCILQGKAFVTSYSEDGAKVIVDTLQPGTFFGDIELYSHRFLALHNVVAVPNTVILKFPLHLINSNLNKNVTFLNFMCQKLTEKLLITSANYSTALLLSSKNKLAKYLINETELNQSTTFSFSVKRISEVLGVSERHLRRLLNEFEKDHLLLKVKKNVTIIDLVKLHKITG
ncbi:Crp/Fnr family transcriptional regulator [Brochothrix thermosphacta]|uniref:Crp/Fnr family transcriptional regulator n=1 Tax=Brochothrix thermosphacta TaxID=2756 RepID=UPI000ED46A17|nr:Crp/Fnr family transcriptional regulator [Brochothrix thermosphacta]HCZ39768.1 hypothetical protein [Brochothrix thermosphacta]HCZ45498.1 hypothetical protein [Brochothrix thermosphacta]